MSLPTLKIRELSQFPGLTEIEAHEKKRIAELEARVQGLEEALTTFHRLYEIQTEWWKAQREMTVAAAEAERALQKYRAHPKEGERGLAEARILAHYANQLSDASRDITQACMAWQQSLALRAPF